MAANGKGRALAGSFGKRVAIQIWAGRSPASLSPRLSPASAFRRASHSSSYDKEVDDQVRPAEVPDHVISSGSDGDKYWGPHPHTGVFGPADEKTGRGGDQIQGTRSSAAGAGNGASVLDQNVWFRPLGLEDVDKTHFP